MRSDDQNERRWNRRSLVTKGAVIAAASVAATGITNLNLRSAAAHNLPAEKAGGPAYDAALESEGGMRGVFQSPDIHATVGGGEDLDHLVFIQLRNWLNSFQFSYEMAPEELHTIVAIYASANTMTYNDTIWEKYQFGEKYEVIDPATGQAAVRNPFFPSRLGLDAPKDPTAENNFYQDVGIEALQERGAVVLC